VLVLIQVSSIEGCKGEWYNDREIVCERERKMKDKKQNMVGREQRNRNKKNETYNE